MSKKKVLILSNPLNHEGGIVNYYNLFFKHFQSDAFELRHMSVGSRAYLFYYPRLKRILYPVYLVFDILKFVGILIFDNKIKIVQVSPSLIPVPLIRDGIFVLIAKLFRKNIVVFYRGWKLPTYYKLKSSKRMNSLFNFTFQRNTYQVVLAQSFKRQLMQLSTKETKEIWVTTTAIDVNQIVDSKPRNNELVEVLFLARIQDLKGVRELIQAIILLKESNLLQRFRFTFAGHEAKSGIIQELQKQLEQHEIDESRVKFVGRVNGVEKFNLYGKSEVYTLPSYTEGCPNSVLEALSSGLYCITTNVGALDDLVIDNKNGKHVAIQSTEELYEALCEYEKNKDTFRKLDFAAASKAKFDVCAITDRFNSKYIEICDAK